MEERLPQQNVKFEDRILLLTEEFFFKKKKEKERKRKEKKEKAPPPSEKLFPLVKITPCSSEITH